MHRTPYLLAAMVVVALCQLAFGLSLENRLADGDGYMWLMRVTDLYRSGDWYAQAQVQTNAPFGETLHWTRPFDVVLLAGALAGTLVADFDAALWAWARVVGPALSLAVVPVWSWGTRHLFTDRQFLLSILLMTLLWRIALMFQPARPDHHAFLGLLFVAVVAGVIRLPHLTPQTAAAVGAVAGLGLWASIEALIVLVYAAGVMALFWITRPCRRAAPLAAYLGAAMAVVVVGLGAQRPPAEWLTERYAQMAAPHGWMMVAAAAAWGAVAWAEARSPLAWTRGRRTAAAVLAAAVVVAAMAAVYPRFFAGPWIDYDVGRIAEWLPTIREFHPVLPTSAEATAFFILEAGPVLLGLAWAVWSAARGSERERVPMAALALGIMIFLPMGMNQGRWLYYAQFLAAVPWALAVSAGWSAAGRLARPAGRVVARIATVVVLVLGPLIAGSTAMAVAGGKPADQRCGWVGMAAHLKATLPPGAIVLSHTFAGPELAWWSGLRVVGAPYGHDSIWETWRFFRARDDGTPRAIAEGRGVAAVLVCGKDRESPFLGSGDPDSLHARLQHGRPPEWLRPVALPDPLGDFRLFLVKHEAAAPTSGR